MYLLSIDHHVLQFCDLSGQACGVMGSLFFAYDLLGRPGGLLRLLLRIAIPGAISSLILLFAALVLVVVAQPDYTITVNIIAVLVVFGAVLGTFNGIFVSAPGEGLRRPVFSLRDAIVGVVAVTAIFGIAELLQAFFVAPSLDDAYTLLSLATVGFLAAGFWSSLNRDPVATKETRERKRSRTQIIGAAALLLVGLLVAAVAGVAGYELSRDVLLPQVRALALCGCVLGGILWIVGNPRQPSPEATTPSLYTRRGARIGVIAGFLAVFIVVLSFFVLSGLASQTFPRDLRLDAFSAFVYAVLSSIGGGISGGLTRYIFWRANTLPARGLEVIGLFLILAGFAVQALNPLVGLLNIPIY